MDEQSDILPSLLSGFSKTETATDDRILNPDPVTPPNTPDVHVFSVSGFGTGSSGDLVSSGPETSGVGHIADVVGLAHPGSTVDKFSYDQQGEVVERLQSFGEDDHNIGVVHSLGVGALLDAAREANVQFDAIYTVDHPAFLPDQTKPDNVTFGTNFYSTSGDGIDGDPNLGGMTNIGVAGTTHTQIDNDTRVADWIAADSQGAVIVSTPPEPAPGTFGAPSDPWTSSVDWGTPASSFPPEPAIIRGCDDFGPDPFGGSSTIDSGSASGSDSGSGSFTGSIDSGSVDSGSSNGGSD